MIIKGKAYSTETVGDIPREFQPSYNATRCNDKMIIFHGRESPFSNFHPSEFTIGDHTYCHNEQFYQSKKAQEFNDENLAAKIRSTKDPLECFKLGNRVKWFNRAQWSKIEENVMFDGALAKFAQVAHLREALAKTEDKMLAESSTDKTWASGLPMYHASAYDSSCWTGENKLGKVLMLVRQRLVV